MCIGRREREGEGDLVVIDVYRIIQPIDKSHDRRPYNSYYLDIEYVHIYLPTVSVCCCCFCCCHYHCRPRCCCCLLLSSPMLLITLLMLLMLLLHLLMLLLPIFTTTVRDKRRCLPCLQVAKNSLLKCLMIVFGTIKNLTNTKVNE